MLHPVSGLAIELLRNGNARHGDSRRGAMRLVRTLGPRFDEIDAELAALSELREKPAGTIRITTGEHAAEALFWPVLVKLLPHYPDIKVELIIDYGLTDIVAERYDAGVRLGEQVARDMIAVRIGPDFRMAVVGAPSYFARRSRPKKPQDLTAHDCINLRLPTYDGIYVWEFEKRGRELKVRSRRAVGVQQYRPEIERGTGWVGPRVNARGQGADMPRSTEGSFACSTIGWTFQSITTPLPEPPPVGRRPSAW